MRRSRLLTLVIGLGLIVAACASPASAPSDSTDDEPTAGTAQSEPAEESEPPAESQAEDGDDGGGGEAPALADGPWTGGHGQMTVSGAVNLTTDAPLTIDISSTEESKTLLAYNTEREFVTIFINFIGVPFHADVTGDDFSASGDDCEVTYNRADDTGIDATFTCQVDEFYWFSADPEPSGDVTIEGSFTATR